MPPAEPASEGQLCILVLGMHRSGTSALTRVLNLMGAALPRDILGANLGNDTGHWEPATLGDLNERTLHAIDRCWYDCRRIDQPIDSDVEAFLAYEISWQYRGLSPFVLKDPRVCLLMPSYQRALAAIGARTVNVLALRSPMAISASLARRNNMPEAHGRWLWLRYLLEAELATRGTPRIFVGYEDIMADWRSALAPLAEMAGMNLPAPGSLESREIEEFLSPAQRHHPSVPIDASNDLGEWLVEADAALAALADNTSDAAAQARLDDIHDALDAAAVAPGFDPNKMDVPGRGARNAASR